MSGAARPRSARFHTAARNEDVDDETAAMDPLDTDVAAPKTAERGASAASLLAAEPTSADVVRRA